MVLMNSAFYLIRNAPTTAFLEELIQKPVITVSKLSHRLLTHLRRTSDGGKHWEELCVTHKAKPQFVFELENDSVRLRLKALSQKDGSVWQWNGHEWQRVKGKSKSNGKPELIDDERFADMGTRAQNSAACVAILDEVFASKPRAEWLEILRKGGDFIFTVVNSLDDLPDDPQMRVNGYIVDFDHPVFGETPMVGIPVRLSETPGRIRAPAPEHGQHTELILTEELGYGWDDVAALREKGVL